MNPQEIYDVWKARKSQGDVDRRFSDQVMAAIRRREARRAIGDRVLLRHMAAQPWAKAAALILGALLGLARIAATLHLILFA